MTHGDSDLEDTPNDLRNILERALGEEASVVSLDKFLPRIREIIINLLQGVKRKQQIHRIQSGEAAAPIRMRRTDSQGTHHSSDSRNMDISRQRSASPSVLSRSGTSSHAPTTVPGSVTHSPSKRQLPVVPGHLTSPSQIQAPRKAPSPPSSSRELFSPAPPLAANNDPVTQLSQMTLERRSSKRFSENYLAQLTSSPNSDRSGKLSVDGVRKHLQRSITIPEAIEDEAGETVDYSASRAYGSPPNLQSSERSVPLSSPSLPSPSYKVIHAPRARSPHAIQASAKSEDSGRTTNGGVSLSNSPLMVFVKFEDQTKKVTLGMPTSLEKLDLAIRAIFAELPDFSIYIEDLDSKVPYLLEDVADLQQRSVLSIKTLVRAIGKTDRLIVGDSGGEDLKSWLDQRLNVLSQELIDFGKSSMSGHSTQSVEQKIDRPISEPLAGLEPTKTTSNGAMLADLEAARDENTQLQARISELQTALAKAEATASPSIVVSANRDHVMSMSAKHDHLGTELTAKLEEAMNDMERIRKDVLQRKVSPRPQQLVDLSKRYDEIKIASEELAANLVVLDSESNRLWEQELTIITTEQDALEYQRAFIDDIKADLEQSLSSLSTIKQVEEQKRFVPVSSAPMIVETSTDPSRALKFVQADIKSLQVNHERRAAAIADADKQREKDREYLLENDFKNELGSFVGSNALKSTGGAAEIDRLREQKDTEHRKQLFSTTGTRQDSETTVEPQAPSQASRIRSPDPDGDVSAPLDATKPGDVQEKARSDSAPTAVAKPRVVSSSASILARIDAAKAVDTLDRRRSSVIMKHVLSSTGEGHVSRQRTPDLSTVAIAEGPVAGTREAARETAAIEGSDSMDGRGSVPAE